MSDVDPLHDVVLTLREAARLNTEIARLNAQATRFERAFTRWFPALLLAAFIAGLMVGAALVALLLFNPR